MDLSDISRLALSAVFAYGPFLAAFLIASLLVVVAITMSGLALRWQDHHKLTLIFAAIVLGSTISVAMSGRVIHSEEYLASNPALMSALSVDNGSSWASRLASLIVLSISISEILLWILRKREMGKDQFSIWVALILYYMAIIPISGAFGSFRDVSIRYFYSPIVFTAIALLVNSKINLVLAALRWVIFLPLGLGLLAALVTPGLVLETGYKSLIPGFSVRLAGFTQHANMLGFFALISLLIETSKYVVQKPNWAIVIVSVLNLLLAQSKTMWVAAVFIFSFVKIYFYWKESVRLGNGRFGLKVACSLSFVASVVFVYFFWKIDAISTYLAADKTGLTTFTGRTLIWQLSFDEFLNSPVFGYGPSIWDPLYRFQKGLPAVGQAHNQFMQVLGQAGALGILTMTFYLYRLASFGLRSSVNTRGLSLALIALILVRGFSETPLHMNFIVGLDVFAHLLIFSVVIAGSINTVDSEVKK